MQEKLEETESVLESTLSELTALRSLYNIETNNRLLHEKENMQEMEKKIVSLENSMQQTVAELEEGRLANIEMAFNNKALERKMEETKSDVDSVMQQFDSCKRSCDASLARMEENGKVCSNLETSLRTFIQEQKNCRIDFRVGNLELAFQSAIKGIEKTTKTNEELKRNGKLLQENVDKCLSNVRTTEDMVKVQSQYVKEHSSRLKEIDESLLSVDSKLNKIFVHEKSVGESLRKVDDKLGHHDNQFTNSLSETQALASNMESLRVTLDCNTKSFDEKLSITSKIITDRVTASFQDELNMFKNKITSMESNNHVNLEEIKNDIVALEAEWAAKYDLIEKDVSSVAAKLFDGEDWETSL